MSHQQTSDIVIYLCKNCIPQGAKFPAQWTDVGKHVRIKEIPCSGKIDVQYMLHALEGGLQGVCIVTCPVGQCTLVQGNYRSQIRVNTVKRLLSEVGMNPDRASLVRCPANATAQDLDALIHDAARRLACADAVANLKEG